MRWESWQPPQIGDRRVKTKFLLFPKNIEGETRWLEKATYKEKYCNVYIRNPECHGYIEQWVAIEWVD